VLIQPSETPPHGPTLCAFETWFCCKIRLLKKNQGYCYKNCWMDEGKCVSLMLGCWLGVVWVAQLVWAKGVVVDSNSDKGEKY
jgi:hypothetical protein